MNSAWLQGLALASVGLAVLGVCAFALVRAWRKDPITSYRMLVWVAAAALLIPLVQGFVQGRAAAPPTTTRNTPATESAVLAAEPSNPRPGRPEPHRLLRRAQPLNTGVVHTIQPAVALEPEASTAGMGTEAPRGSFPWLRVLAISYLVGLVATLTWQGLRLMRTLRLLRRCHPTEHPAILETWNDVCTDPGLRERVRLLESDEIASPACWGFGRPVLVVPMGAGDRAHRNALQCALTHELIHLERGDARVSALQALIRILFWFHPAIWWLCRELDQLREISCDLLVVRRTGRAKSYALALLDYAFGNSAEDLEVDPRGRDAGRSRRAMRAACPSLLHWTRSPSQLRTRIEMLAMNQTTPSKRTGKARWLLAGGLLCTLGASQLAVAASNLSPFRSATESKATPAVALAEIPLLGPFLEAAWKLQGETTAQLDDDELAELLADIERLEAELAGKVDTTLRVRAAQDAAAEAASVANAKGVLSHLASLGYVGDVDTDVRVNINEATGEVLEALGYVGDVTADVHVNVETSTGEVIEALSALGDVAQDADTTVESDAQGRFTFRSGGGGVVQGRVLSEAGEPVQEARILVEGSDGKRVHSFTTQTNHGNARTFFMTEDGKVLNVETQDGDGEGKSGGFWTTLAPGHTIHVQGQGDGDAAKHRIYALGRPEGDGDTHRRFFLNRAAEWVEGDESAPQRLRSRLTPGVRIRRSNEQASGSRDELMERLDEVIERLERLEDRIDGLSEGSAGRLRRRLPQGRFLLRGQSEGDSPSGRLFWSQDGEGDVHGEHEFSAPFRGRIVPGRPHFLGEDAPRELRHLFEWRSDDGEVHGHEHGGPNIWFSGDDGEEQGVYSWHAGDGDHAITRFGLLKDSGDGVIELHGEGLDALHIKELEKHFGEAHGDLEDGVYLFSTSDGTQGKVRIDHDHGDHHDQHEDHDSDHGELRRGAVRYELRDMEPGTYRLRLRGEDGDGQILRLGEGVDAKAGQLFGTDALIEFEYDGEISPEDIQIDVERIEDLGVDFRALDLEELEFSDLELGDVDFESLNFGDLDIQVHGLEHLDAGDLEILGGSLEGLDTLLEGKDLKIQTEGSIHILGDHELPHGIRLHGLEVLGAEGLGDVRIQTLVEGLEGIQGLDAGVLKALGDADIELPVDGTSSTLRLLPLVLGGQAAPDVELLRHLGEGNHNIEVELQGLGGDAKPSRALFGNRILRGLEIHPEVEGSEIRLEIRTEGDGSEGDSEGDEGEIIEFALESSEV